MEDPSSQEASNLPLNTLSGARLALAAFERAQQVGPSSSEADLIAAEPSPTEGLSAAPGIRGFLRNSLSFKEGGRHASLGFGRLDKTLEGGDADTSELQVCSLLQLGYLAVIGLSTVISHTAEQYTG